MDEIHVDNIQTDEQYELINIRGNIEQRGTLHKGTNTVPVSGLPPGLHLLQLTAGDGRKTITKVVKQP